MKKHILITGTLLLGSLAFAEKPNVIVIITDDQGYGDLACHGNTISNRWCSYQPPEMKIAEKLSAVTFASALVSPKR